MWRRNRDCARRFLIDPVKEMVNKGIETAATGAGWLKGGPQMVSDVVCGVVDTWVSVIDPNEGTIRKAMSGDAATLDALASLASPIGAIVFVVYVCMTAVNLFLATAESVRDYFKNYLTIPKLSKAIPVVGQYLAPADAPFATVTGPIQKYVLDPVKNVLLRRHFILFALFALASRATSTSRRWRHVPRHRRDAPRSAPEVWDPVYNWTDRETGVTTLYNRSSEVLASA